MAFATINKGASYFTPTLYTGTGSVFPTGNAITGLDFRPDFVWIKSRSNAYPNFVWDAVRGTANNAYLITNSTGAENNFSAYGNQLISFDSGGFTVANDTAGSVGTNGSGATFASWSWLGANTTVSNTQGSISSTVSANTTSGFSIVSYTGTATAGATVGHGLGVAPSMIITKARTIADNWGVYHKSLGATKALYLNTTNAGITSSAYYNNTAPSSTVVTLGDNEATNDNAGMIMYAFAEVKGYSKFGSYTGNGNANGTFIYTGFRPSFFLIKNTTTAGNGWHIFDNKRIGFNTSNYQLSPSDSGAEDTTTGYTDILSNGFKMRSTNDFNNKNGDTYIYMAFAENPFVLTDGTPVTAR